MGNQSGKPRRKSEAETPSDYRKRRGKSSANGRTSARGDQTDGGRDKHISCPDLGGAVPYKSQDDTVLNVKIHRSYGNLTQSQHGTLKEETNYKVYRKSAEGVPRYSTLPRNFGRSRSTSAAVGNGTLHYPELRRQRSPENRASRASSVSTLMSAPVYQDDFPETAEIKRKLKLFEDNFGRALTERYQTLQDTVQLSALAIAIKKTPKDARYVSLYDYLDSQNVPLDLRNEGGPNEEFIMLVPEALMYGIMHVRRDKISDYTLWTSLARDLVTCIAVEAANEISRMFEYQIAVLTGDVSVKALAEHASDCVIDFIKRKNAYLDRNTAVHGVVYGNPPEIRSSAKYLSVVLGNRELKWDLYEIFKKPGLRREVFLFADGVGEDGSAPWAFYTSDVLDPMMYGYRSLLLEWDWVEKFYRVNQDDEGKFNEEMVFRVDDFHRNFNPYRRLFGLDMMLHYIDLKEKGRTSAPLAQFINYSAGGDSARDDIQPVYRPLSPTQKPLDFGTSNLDNVDLTRAQFNRADLSRTSMRKARVHFADAEDAKLRQTDVSGADMSYSCMAGADIQPEILRTVKTSHVTIATQKPAQHMNGHVTHGNGHVVGDVTAENGDLVDGNANKQQMVFDVDGNMVTVSQGHRRKRKKKSIEKKQKQVEEEKFTREQQQQQQLQTCPASTSSSPCSIPNGDAVPEKGILRKKKKSRVPPSNDPSSDTYLLNTSFPTTTSEKQRHLKSYPSNDTETRHNNNNTYSQPPQQQQQQQQQRQQQPLRGVLKNTSATLNGHQSQQYIPEERPASAAGTTTRGHSFSSSGLQGRAPQETDGSATLPYPHMAKSVSHHGQLSYSQSARATSVTGAYGLGTGVSGSGGPAGFGVPRRLALSREQVEYITRSQIFNMLKGLHIENIESNLKDGDGVFVGRDVDVENVVDLLSSSGRIVTITGCYGLGKSALANAVSHELNRKFILPMIVEMRGCVSVGSCIQRLTATFGLHFQPRELSYFYNWVNSHEQRVLLVMDNVELKEEDDGKFSDLLDEMMTNIKNLRLLVTSSRSFYRGNVGHELYRLGDLHNYSVGLLQQLTPDLHDEGIEALADACDKSPFLLRTLSKVFAMEEVDAGKLFEDVSNGQDHELMMRLGSEIVRLTDDELEQDRLIKMANCVLKMFDNLPIAHIEVLSTACVFAAFFDVSTLTNLIGGADEETVGQAVADLVDVGLIIAKDGNKFILSSLIKFVALGKLSDNGATIGQYCNYYVENLKLICAKYHSKKSCDAIKDLYNNFDNVIDVLWRVVEREDAYEVCPSYPTLEYALFLGELLPEDIYVQLFESLASQAEEQGDHAKECRSMCCLAHKYNVEGKLSRARSAVDKAYDIVHSAGEYVSDTDRAFCLRCMGKIMYDENNDRPKAQALVKKSLDIYKVAIGSRHLQTLYANELYAWMLTQQENHQTARHFYNISDFFVKETLDEHPLMVDGYACRREIWDRLCLFQRATDMAKKSSDVSQQFYGDHPLTATMLANQCEAIIKRGSLNDAVSAAVTALSIRVKTLGDHLDTGTSYKTMAYLMLRSGQYDEACRFGQNALEIFEKLDAAERLKIDAKNVMAQARYRLEYKSSVFVELQSKDAKKSVPHPEPDRSRASSVVSTEV